MSEQIKYNWIPFPIYILDDGDGERALVPNDWQLSRAEESVRMAQAHVDKLEQSKADDVEIQVGKTMVKSRQAQLDSMRDIVAQYRSEAQEVKYFVRKTTFGEYVDCEEQSKTWVGGEPRTDQNKFMIRLMDGRIMLDNNTLSVEEIRNMDADVPSLLFRRLEELCFPNAERIPFWSSRLRT